MKKYSVIFSLFILTNLCFPAAFGQEMEKGKIIERIVCRENPEKSYALYLPSSYTAEKRWPILYGLDPGARGRIPVELFRAGAEKYGYILAGSNDSRNGPWQDIIQSIIVLWNDTNDRFAIDKNRIYVTGFSGGSRGASIFARIIMHPVAGIIGCGAGLANSLIKPEQIKPVYYLGIVGITDFNFREMMRLRDQLAQQDISHRFLVHPGGHEWPTQETCLRALEWIEIIAIRNDLRPMDEELIDRVFEKEGKIARTMEDAGDWVEAVSLYRTLAENFKGWKDTSPIQTRMESIQKNGSYLEQLLNETRIKEREIAYLRKFGQIYDRIEKGPPPVEEVEKSISSLGLDDLIKTREANIRDKEYALAVRLLNGLEFDAGSKGMDFFQKGEFVKAIFFLEIAANGGDEDSSYKKNVYYNLACAYARTQNTDKALENLRSAVVHGYNDIRHMEEDTDLLSIRDTDEYRNILKILKRIENTGMNFG